MAGCFWGVAHGVRRVRVHPVGEWADSNIACKQPLTGWHACAQPAVHMKRPDIALAQGLFYMGEDAV